MRKIALAAMLLALPAAAQQQTIATTQLYNTYANQTLLLTNDAICVPLSGQQFATAMWTVGTAGSGGITTEYTNDPSPTPCSSPNWLASPYSKRLDQATANPSVAPWTNNTPVAGRYETPLPGTATAFRIRYQTAGTSTVITLTGGAALVPGVPVVAILFDVTSATNTALDTGVLDLAGWAVVSSFFNTPAAGSGTITHIDDAGSALVAGGIVTIPASASVYVNFAAPPSLSGTAVAAGATGYFGPIALQKRMRFQTAAVAAVTSRIRIEARR